MSSSGSDASAKAREAEYLFNAQNARTTAKRSIEGMFGYAEDYSQQATGSLSQAVALLGKYGYIDKDKYHTRGGTQDLGITIDSTDVGEITDTVGLPERLAEITESLDEYKEKYDIYYEKYYKEGDNGDNASEAALLAKNRAEKELGIDSDALTKEQNEIRDDAEANSETRRLVEGQGGIGDIAKISTTSSIRRIRGSAFDSVMAAKRTMYRDRSKIIREGITSSFDALKAGKHYQQGAEFASQEASYLRRQSALNNFFRVSGSALTIIGLKYG